MAAQEGGEERTAVALSWKEIHPHLRHLLQVETGAAARTSKQQVGRDAPLQAFHTPTPPPISFPRGSVRDGLRWHSSHMWLDRDPPHFSHLFHCSHMALSSLSR